MTQSEAQLQEQVARYIRMQYPQVLFHSDTGSLARLTPQQGARRKKKNGEWANQHIAEQAEVLLKLRERGYAAEFAVGFDEAKRIIDDYLK